MLHHFRVAIIVCYLSNFYCWLLGQGDDGSSHRCNGIGDSKFSHNISVVEQAALRGKKRRHWCSKLLLWGKSFNGGRKVHCGHSSVNLGWTVQDLPGNFNLRILHGDNHISFLWKKCFSCSTCPLQLLVPFNDFLSTEDAESSTKTMTYHYRQARRRKENPAPQAGRIPQSNFWTTLRRTMFSQIAANITCHHVCAPTITYNAK